MLASAVLRSPRRGARPRAESGILSNSSPGRRRPGRRSRCASGEGPPPVKGTASQRPSAVDVQQRLRRSPSASGATCMPGRVIVKFRDGMSRARVFPRALERVADRRADDAETMPISTRSRSIRPRIRKPLRERFRQPSATSSTRRRPIASAPYFVPSDPDTRPAMEHAEHRHGTGWDIQPGSSSSGRRGGHRHAALRIRTRSCATTRGHFGWCLSNGTEHRLSLRSA